MDALPICPVTSYFILCDYFIIGLECQVDGTRMITGKDVHYCNNSIPFVNRKQEVVELALYNAKAIFMIRSWNITDYRPMSFVFAAQMFGAGKTRLGSEFLKQVCSYFHNCPDVFEEYCPPTLLCDLEALVEIVKEFRDATHVFIEFGSTTTCLDFLELKGYSKLEYFITDVCDVSEKPVFFHFDEVGYMTVNELRSLRDGCLQSLKNLMAENRHARNFPLFFFSGRGAAYNELGYISSNVSSKWLILEPLHIPHVKTIIQSVSNSRSNFSFHKSLSEEQLIMIADHLIDWTGGAPRPLLFVINILEALHKCHGHLYKTKFGLREVFNALVEFITANNALLRELGPVSSCGNLTHEEAKAYHYFY